MFRIMKFQELMIILFALVSLSRKCLEVERSSDVVDLADVMLNVIGKKTASCSKQEAVSEHRVRSGGLK